MAADGIGKMIRRRGAQAGIDELQPHMFRHTFAHEWLSEGGTEGDLAPAGDHPRSAGSREVQ